LALVKELVHLLGGTIEARSTEGRGSTFQVNLPIENQQTADQPLALHTSGSTSLKPKLATELAWLQASGNTTASPESHTITDEERAYLLVVGDNADMRQYLQKMLAPYYQISVAVDGEDALQKVNRRQPDLIISDIMMPRLDGQELLKRLRANEATRIIPVIFLSARAGEEAKVSGLEAGADDYLVKPFSARELLARVSTQLSMQRMRRQVRQQEQELRQEAERQRAYLNRLFQQAPVAITILKGQDLVVELANERMWELWDRRPEQMLDKPMFSVLTEAQHQGFEDMLRGVLSSGQPFAANEVPAQLYRHGQLETVYVNFVFHPYRNEFDEVAGIIAVVNEVNEQVRARHEVEAINQELRAVNSDLDNFVYTASHDLKGPIINIESLVKLLIPRLEKVEKFEATIKPLTDMIFTSVDRFKNTIRDLSEITKVQRGQPQDVEPVDLGKVVQEVKLDLALQIEEADAEITLEVNECPQVQFSAKNIRSIVYNLLSNALKYRSPQRRPQIAVSCRAQAEYLVLEVSDNGLGMDLSEKQSPFKMFKRLHSHVEGTGIGLYIVKRILDLAEGKIEVESQVDKGTTFWVYLKR
jgi:signal transduction histidine kinase